MGGPDGFSVVVPAFDRAATVARTLDSVRRAADERRRAGAGPTEIILVDDGSSDATAARAAAVAATDDRVRVLHQPNAGVSAARNLGAAHATGRWLAFVDCDDEVDPRWLVELGGALAAGARLAFAPGLAVHPDGRERRWRVLPLGPAFAGIEGLFNPAMFAMERADFEAVGGYAVALTFSENTELGLRLAAHLEAHDAVTTTGLTRPLVTLAMPERGNSNANEPAARLHSALYLLDTHGDRLARDPALHASYWAIAGVAAGRLDDRRLARRCFARAVRADPRSLQQLGRAAAAAVPPVRRRLWPAAG